MKIVMVAVNATFCHTNLAVRYLRDYVGSRMECDISLAEFSCNDSVDRIVSELYSRHADIYAFSCYIWNITIIDRICSDLHKMLPDIVVVLGGPQVSYNADEYISDRPYIDHIITGKGAGSLYKLTSDLASANAVSKIITGEDIPLSELTFPYSDIDDFQSHIQYYYETSTGCPYTCSYCLSSANCKVEFLEVDRVKSELRRFIDGGARIVKLVDRTFNIDSNRAIDIWKFLIDVHRETAYQTVFHFEIAGDLLSAEQLAVIATAPAGIFRFECGIQSFSTEVLQNVNRTTNQDKLVEGIKVLVKRGNVELHLDLIAGLPGENMASFAKSINETLALRPDMLQLGFLKMLKGSRIRRDADALGLIYSDYPPYQILSTPTLSYEDLISLHRIARITDIYYNSGLYKYSLDWLFAAYDSGEETDIKDKFHLLLELSDRFAGAGGYIRNLTRRDNLLLFLKFGTDLLTSEHDKLTFTGLVKFDYYRYDCKGYIPELMMNQSDKHILLDPIENAQLLDLDNHKWKNRKKRIEHFPFDVASLIKTHKAEGNGSFVLYAIDGDKPEVLETLAIK